MSPGPISTRDKVAVMAVTSWAMTMSTIQLFAIAVLAAELISEFGLSRWQIGVLGAMNTGVGALSAPALGRIIDRLPVRSATTLVVACAGLGMLLTAAAPSYWLLLVASALSGLPQGASNPVTNKVIADLVPKGSQSSVTGVKQSGVQLAVFLAGATLPGAAVTVGWRTAVAIFGVIGVVSALVVRARFPVPGPDMTTVDASPSVTAVPTLSVGSTAAPGPGGPHGPGLVAPVGPAAPDGVGSAQRFVTIVAVYAFLLGVTAGGMTRFYPLFAHEVLGYAETTAGLAVSLVGLLAIAARLFWARVADTVFGIRSSLVVLGVGSAVAAGLLLLAPGQRWLLWPAVVLIALTASAWNSVAMLAVIRAARPEELAQSTGVVLFGFLGGVTVAAPLVGWSVDRLGSYDPAWAALGLTALIGAVVVRPTRRAVAGA